MTRQLGLISDSSVDMEIVRQVLVDELNKQDHRLLVLDNVDEVGLIRKFLPTRRGMRHVLVTGRYRESYVPINGYSTVLENLTECEASLLFSGVYLGHSETEHQ
jgi:hypothetical protein